MADAKIEIKIGGLTFAGEGTEAWLGEQLEKLLAKADDFAAATAPASVDSEQHHAAPNGPCSGTPKPTTTLATFLSSNNATANQVLRFLTTAEWLTRKGTAKLTTSDVVKALKDNHQARLGNASDTLNSNVEKGYCEKDGKEFFVTPEGRAMFNGK